MDKATKSNKANRGSKLNQSCHGTMNTKWGREATSEQLVARGNLNPDSEHEDDYERARIRNRERNKEHARKTRARKKEQLGRLKARVTELEEESKSLQLRIQEKSVASILLGLSTGSAECAGRDYDDLHRSPVSSSSSFSSCLASGKRKRFLSLDGEETPQPPMQLNVKGQIALVGGIGGSSDCKAQVNWKTGVYVDREGNPQQLTKSELEALRRERNRMHAKMTRDRKKCFIASLKRVVSKLERENQQLRETLEKSNEQKETQDLSSSCTPGSHGDKESSSSMFNSYTYTVG